MDLSKLTILNEQFVLRKTLGDPGLYDVTYLAWNLMKEQDAVIVREYNPAHLAQRSTDGFRLECKDEKQQSLYDYGLNCFEREAAAAAIIDHPNVVKQIAYFRENGSAYTVSEYYPGATLAKVIEAQQGKLPEKAAFTIMMPLLNGLLAGHRKGLIHGRLSPQRIFLTKSGRPMLLRFHVTQILLARRCGQVSDMSVPGYTPPELLIPEGKKGPWSDVYACGATLYSIITGQQPPEAHMRMKNDPFPDILDSDKNVSKRLKKVLYRAMSMDWNERPQSILELKQEFLDTMPRDGKSYTEYAPKPEKSSLSEIEESLESYPEAKTATELVSLSRRALAKFKVEPRPMMTGDGGPALRNDWLSELPTADYGEVDLLQRDVPLVDTNPMGPFANDTPMVAEPIESTETEEKTKATSSLRQIITSATASRTRKLSIAALAACLILFIVAGSWLRSSGNATGDGPPQVQAAQQPEMLPAPTQPSYMMLLAQGDSMKSAAELSLAQGDSAQHARLVNQATTIYEQLLAANPGDSLTTERLMAVKNIAVESRLAPPAASVETSESSLSSQQRLTMLVEVYINEADSLNLAGKFVEAKEKYLMALQYEPENTHALSIVKRIDERLATEAIDTAFKRYFDRGEAHLADGDIAEARLAYEQAQRYKPQEATVLERLESLDAMEAEAQNGERQFLVLKEQADGLFDAGNYSAALISYESAQLLNPEDESLTQRISAIKDSLNYLERLSQGLKDQYLAFRAKGDSMLDARAFTQARAHYETALAINPEDEYVKEKMTILEAAEQDIRSATIDENGIYLIPEVLPTAIDEAGMHAKLVYPRSARNYGKEGRVVVRMVVDEEGRTSQHSVVKGIGFGCDDEAIRVLQETLFTPATHKGQTVKAWHNYSIVFKLVR